MQWGTAACLAAEDWEAGCVTETPVPPASLDSPPVEEDVTTDPIVLSGLTPNTTYRYRFVAEGSGEPGELIIGVGGTPGVEGADASFTTSEEVLPVDTCPNKAFRAETEAGKRLRDCRAYELVSPIDKDGGDIQARLNIVPFEARQDQASLSGNELTFSAYRAFQNPKSAPFSSQYLTKRTSAGWQTEAISPPQEGEAFINPLNAIDNLYRLFSPDLKQAWLYTFTEPVLAPGGVAGEPNVYRRDNTAGTYKACSTSAALSDQTETHSYMLQGVSADGNLAAFKIEGKLTPDGSDELKAGARPINQAYVCAFDNAGNATVRLVSVLPDGSASDLENTIGGPANQVFQGSQGRTESLENAVSADGSIVYWTASSSTDTESPGALYVRLNPGAEPTVSGACDEVGKACTVEISAGPARFWKASDDGAIALFSEGDELFEYEVATDETRLVAEEFLGLVGASEDLSRIYFLSEKEINGEGEAGEPNLYLGDKVAETTTFIATLSERDAEQGKTAPSPGNYQPAFHSARVTPDGTTVAFMSNSAELAELVAGYDNTDQITGLPAAEIYRYEQGGELACVSCNRTGQRPQGREIQNKHIANSPTLPAASMLPTWLNALYAPRVLSEDGNRIFFEAFEGLVPADTNGKSDVYQWEAEGKGNCTAADSAYDPQSEGCVSLLSSGTGPNDSQFVDASPSGDDVFIRTGSSLVTWDPGALDIYDVRVGGGFSATPPPPDPKDGCAGEGCQPAPTPNPPAAAAPPTTQPSEGNQGKTTKPKPKPKRCPKGKRRVKRGGKFVCVKAKQGKAGKSGRGR